MGLLNMVVRENVPAWSAVTGDGYVADSSAMAHLYHVAGVVRSSGLGNAIVATSGDALECPLWAWTVGRPVYLNGKVLSQTPPVFGFLQIIGVATRVDQMLVQLYTPTIIVVPSEPVQDVGGGVIQDVGGGEVEGV